MIVSYYLFLSSLASRFSLDHRKVNLASIIAPTRTAQIQRGGLSTFLLFFHVIKRIYALALKFSHSWRVGIYYNHHQQEVVSFLNLLSFSFTTPYTKAKPCRLYYFLTVI